MLSISPASSCDVCLEPFTEDLKAPCSILCGHVFCSTCLQQVERPTCPLCRHPFEARHVIRLHVDVDSLRRPSASPHAHPPALSPDDEARHLQERIIQLASNGATEEQTTRLTEDSKVFLAGIPKNMYADLRTSVKMLSYLAHVKNLYRDQVRNVTSLSRANDSLTQESDRLKAAVEVLKLEKRRLEQNWQTASTERDDMAAEYARLQEQLSNVEGQLVLMTEQNETSQNQLVLLNEELQRLRAEAEFFESSPEGDSPADIPDYPPDLSQHSLHWPQIPLDLDLDDRDSSAPFLTPWDGVIESKALPDIQDPGSSQDDDGVPNRTLCGAAGCPHSCECMPFLLFSPGAQARANMARFQSGLSLSLREHNRSRSRSRSDSRPRSRSLSRAPSPLQPEAMSMSINIPPNNPQAYVLRGRLHDLLTDPHVASSLPNMSTMHLPSSPSPLTREVRHTPSSTFRGPPAPVSRDSPLPVPPPAIPATEYDRAGSGKTKEWPPPLHPPMLYSVASSSKVKESHPTMSHAGGSNRDRPTSGKSRDNYAYPHPPMLYGSPVHTEASKPPLYRSSSGVSTDTSRTTEKERRRNEKAALRGSPAAHHPPMMLPPSPSPPHSASRLSAPTVSGLRLSSPASSSSFASHVQGRSPAPPVVHAASAQAYLQGQPAHRVQVHARPPSPPPSAGNNNASTFTVLDQHIRQTERDVIAAYNNNTSNSRPPHGHVKSSKRAVHAPAAAMYLTTSTGTLFA